MDRDEFKEYIRKMFRGALAKAEATGRDPVQAFYTCASICMGVASMESDDDLDPTTAIQEVSVEPEFEEIAIKASELHK